MYIGTYRNQFGEYTVDPISISNDAKITKQKLINTIAHDLQLVKLPSYIHQLTPEQQTHILKQVQAKVMYIDPEQQSSLLSLVKPQPTYYIAHLNWDNDYILASLSKSYEYTNSIAEDYAYEAASAELLAANLDPLEHNEILHKQLRQYWSYRIERLDKTKAEQLRQEG